MPLVNQYNGFVAQYSKEAYEQYHHDQQWKQYGERASEFPHLQPPGDGIQHHGNDERVSQWDEQWLCDDHEYSGNQNKQQGAEQG
jgi:hypothetical protein